jgi:hypothetical protein
MHVTDAQCTPRPFGREKELPRADVTAASLVQGCTKQQSAFTALVWAASAFVQSYKSSGVYDVQHGAGSS